MYLFIGYLQLLSNGVHIGHHMKSFEFLGSWFLFAIRSGTAIINLYKTTMMLKYSFLTLGAAVNLKSPVWFINMDPSSDIYFYWAALYCGEFYLTSAWVNGFISNFSSIFNFFYYQEYLNLLNVKDSKYSTIIKYWHLTRFTWPRALFVSNVYSSVNPLKEAISLQIPSIGIADTNSQSHSASIPIPGNDDSSSCIIFFNALFSSFISQRKFSAVSAWFFNIRRAVRPVSFFDWVKTSYFDFKFPKFFDLVNFYPHFGNVFIKSLNIYFSMNFFKFTSIKKFVILDNDINSFDLQATFSSFLQIKDYLLYLQNAFLYNRFWLKNLFFKKKTLTSYFFDSKISKNFTFPVNILKFQFFKYSLKNWNFKGKYWLNFILKKFMFNNVFKYFILNFKTFRYLNKFLRKTILEFYVKRIFNYSKLPFLKIDVNNLITKNFNVDYNLKFKLSNYRTLKFLGFYFKSLKKKYMFSYLKNLSNFNSRVNKKLNIDPSFRKSTNFSNFFYYLNKMRISNNLLPLGLAGSYYTWYRPGWRFNRFSSRRKFWQSKDSKNFYFLRKLNKNKKNIKNKKFNIFNIFSKSIKDKKFNTFFTLQNSEKNIFNSNLKYFLYGKSNWFFRNSLDKKKIFHSKKWYHYNYNLELKNLKNLLKFSKTSTLTTFFDDLKYYKKYINNKSLFDRLVPIVIENFYPRVYFKIKDKEFYKIVKPFNVIEFDSYRKINFYFFQNFRDLLNEKNILNKNKLTKSDIFAHFYLKPFKYIDLAKEYIDFFEFNSFFNKFLLKKKKYFFSSNNQYNFNLYRSFFFKWIYNNSLLNFLDNNSIFKNDSYGIKKKFFIHKMSFYWFTPHFVWRWQKKIFNFNFISTIRFLHKFQSNRFYLKTLFFTFWSFNLKRFTSIFSAYFLDIILSVHKWY